MGEEAERAIVPTNVTFQLKNAGCKNPIADFTYTDTKVTKRVWYYFGDADNKEYLLKMNAAKTECVLARKGEGKVTIEAKFARNGSVWTAKRQYKIKGLTLLQKTAPVPC